MALLLGQPFEYYTDIVRCVYRLNSPVVSSLSLLASMRIASKKCRPIKLSLPNDVCSNLYVYLLKYQ